MFGSTKRFYLSFCIPDQSHSAIESLNVAVEVGLEIVLVAVVVDQEHFFQDMRRGSVENRVNGAQQDGPALVVEDDDYGGGGQVGGIVPVLALGKTGVGNGTVEGYLV